MSDEQFVMCNDEIFQSAFKTRDIEEFMSLVFPEHWAPIKARILETGATMATESCPWAPRWTPIPPTIRTGKTDFETHIKSCIFRAHDCIHQLWGLPVPKQLNDDAFYLFKRANMCGEVAVLMLTEFVLCNEIRIDYSGDPEVTDLIESRNAIPMLDGPLRHLTWPEIGARLDGLLHKKLRPRWLRKHHPSIAFVDDYVPMLEEDRRVVDRRWQLMKETDFIPTTAPNSRYSQQLDGLELTTWMIDDFAHLLKTDDHVDWPLVEFNRKRRSEIQLPEGWL